MSIEDLKDPHVDIRKPAETDREVLQDWFANYAVDTGLVTDVAHAADDAAMRADRVLERGSVRLMIVDGKPVSMVGTNARTSDMAQIGGVFTPRPLRGRGYAGKALAAYLLELATEGVRQSILFAASEAAARAYEKIGYRHIGHYHLTVLKAPHIQGQP